MRRPTEREVRYCNVPNDCLIMDYKEYRVCFTKLDQWYLACWDKNYRNIYIGQYDSSFLTGEELLALVEHEIREREYFFKHRKELPEEDNKAMVEAHKHIEKYDSPRIRKQLDEKFMPF